MSLWDNVSDSGTSSPRTRVGLAQIGRSDLVRRMDLAQCAESGAAAPRRLGPLLPHAPALDGLRGIAILAVVAFHFVGHHVMTGGWAGVDVFFTLSGFLITSLLLDERRTTGAVSIRRFLARRACRLLPALIVFLTAWTVILAFFHQSSWIAATPSTNGHGMPVDPVGALASVGLALLYVSNWDVIAGGMEAPLPHLWSLSVEEQFYLIWPLVLLAMMRLRPGARISAMATLVAASASLPFFYWNGGAGFERIYFGSDTQAVALLGGACAALCWRRAKLRGSGRRLPAGRAWTGLAVVVAVIWQSPDARIKSLFGAALIAVATAQVIPHVIDSRGRATRLLSFSPLRWLGRRSYALYLWNYVWATWTHPLPAAFGVVLGLAGSLVCTALSWRLVEAPWLRYARRFRAGREPEAVPAVLAAAA